MKFELNGKKYKSTLVDGDENQRSCCGCAFEKDFTTCQKAQQLYCVNDNIIYIEDNIERPKIVCLCGSTRFYKEFQLANLLETLDGNIVLSIGCNTKSEEHLELLGELTQEAKDKLDELHKRKIDLADEILVLNVDNYIGSSTKSEIEYATKLNKPIRYLNPQ